MRRGRWTSWMGSVAGVLVLSQVCRSEAAETWAFEFTPYIWSAGMTGRIGPSEEAPIIDMDFSDLVEFAELGVAGAFEATYNDRYSLIVEGSYFELSLGGAIPGDPAGTTVDLNVDAGMGMVAGSKRVAENVVVYAGARYMYMKTGVNLGQGLSVSDTQDWVDPIIGLRVTGQASEKLTVMLVSDVGGFGANSDTTYHMAGSLIYALNDTYSGIVSYRLLDIDYDRDGFVYDITQNGLFFGLGISF